MKEITGHISDSVHKYQTTSDQQRMSLSEIIQRDVPVVKLSQAAPMEIIEPPEVPTLEGKYAIQRFKLPIKSNDNSDSKTDQETENCSEGVIRDIIKSTLNVVSNRKAKLTIQVELLD